MSKLGFLTRMSRTEICVILMLAPLFCGMIYSFSRGRFPLRYPDYAGETFIRLDQAYYQIWGNAVQVYAFFTNLYPEKPEPFEGYYHVLLLNTQGRPTSSIYNQTETMSRSWQLENGSRVYYNTTISVLTTPIKDVVTVGDTINFNISIDVEEDLLFEDLLLPPWAPKFQLRKGSNNISTEIRFTQGNGPHQVLMFYKASFEEGIFNFTMEREYGYQSVFDIVIFMNMTGEDRRDLGRIWYNVWLLPFSGRILAHQQVDVERGRMFVSFPLNMSLSANKIAFVRSAIEESYIIEINPVAIYLSPPVTLPPACSLIVVYVLYRKWRNLISHLAKYRVFYSCMVIAGILLATNLQFFSEISPVGITFFLSGLCMICAGLASLGVTKNEFNEAEKLYWKTIITAMTLESLPMVFLYSSYIASSRIDVSNLPLSFVLPFLIFLGSCLMGMGVNFIFSFLAGFSLLLGHCIVRVWKHVQFKPKPAAIHINTSINSEAKIPQYFIYCITEIFIVTVWYIILISSSLAVPIEKLWDALWEMNALIFLIPLSAPLFLLLLFESLNITWNGKAISPKLLHKLWSAFAVIAFIAKVFWEGLSSDILSDLFFVFYYLLLISSGFAAGFIGTSRIAMRRALKEITRIGKKYSGLQVTPKTIEGQGRKLSMWKESS